MAEKGKPPTEEIIRVEDFLDEDEDVRIKPKKCSRCCCFPKLTWVSWTDYYHYGHIPYAPTPVEEFWTETDGTVSR